MEGDPHGWVLAGKLTLSVLIWRITMATRNLNGREIPIAPIQRQGMLSRFLMSDRVIIILKTVSMGLSLKYQGNMTDK